MDQKRVFDLMLKLGGDPELDATINELNKRSSELDAANSPKRFTYNKLLHLCWEAQRAKPLGGGA